MHRPIPNPNARRSAGPPARKQAAVESECPKPHPIGTTVAVMILAITLLTLNGRYPSEVAANAAKYTAVALAATMLFDLQKGIANVIRADIMAMLAFYFLTLFEFLFPQRKFDIRSAL
jgi:hypothetical protein